MATLALGIGQDAFTDIRSLFQTSLAGQQKQNATTVVNAMEPLFLENLTTFQNNPTPATQQEAVSNFNYMWLQMTQMVLQDASGGTNAINDRAPGGKFDWWALFYNPIENYKFSASQLEAAAQPADSGAGAAPVSGTAVAPTTNTETAQALVSPSNSVALNNAPVVPVAAPAVMDATPLAVLAVFAIIVAVIIHAKGGLHGGHL